MVPLNEEGIVTISLTLLNHNKNNDSRHNYKYNQHHSNNKYHNSDNNHHNYNFNYKAWLV